jgi:hypothetical protein
VIPVARQFIENQSSLIFQVERFAKNTPYLLRNGDKSELVRLLFDEFRDIVLMHGLELVYKV